MNDKNEIFSDINLRGKTAVVTGAGGGIGSGIVRVLHSCGANVVACDISENAVLATESRYEEGVKAISGDITNQQHAADVVEQASSAFGTLDILVNCAAVGAIAADGLLSCSLDDWQKAVDVHQRGTVNMTQVVGRAIVDRGSGAIVNVSSAAVTKTMGGCAAYTMSKAAIETLTRTLAVQLGPKGIRVNCVSPGPIYGGMGNDFYTDENNPKTQQLMRGMALGRFGQPEEIGWPVAFLCSDKASFITGTVLHVDGGWLAY